MMDALGSGIVLVMLCDVIKTFKLTQGCNLGVKILASDVLEWCLLKGLIKESLT